MLAGLDLLSPGGEGRVSPQRETRLSWRSTEYFRLYYQRDRILNKVTFGQNRSALHTLYYKYKANYSTILRVLQAWLDSLCVSAL
jgi:hypothetical protein